MVDTSLSHIFSKLKAAKSHAEVFNGTDPVARRTEYLRLVKVLHPDRYQASEDKDMAQDALVLLQMFWGMANTQQPKKQTKFKTRKYTHVLNTLLHTGGTCGVFEAVTVDRNHSPYLTIARVPHVAADNDLMKHEAEVCKAFKMKLGSLDELTSAYFGSRVPVLLESVSVKEPSGQNRTVNLFVEQLESRQWVSLEEIRKVYSSGLDPRVTVFILNRILESLTFAHSVGYLHGALTPQHVLIHPPSHGGLLIDWTAAVKLGTDGHVPYIEQRYKGFYPDEYLNKGRASQSSDIYMAAMCALYALGGDIEERVLPDTGLFLQGLLNESLQPRQSRRVATAEEAKRRLMLAAEHEFGPPKFIEFHMPVR